MEEIARDFRIYCGEDYAHIVPGNFVYAAATHSLKPRFWTYDFFTRVYFDEFRSSRFRHGSVQQRHRLLFQFAITLLHELAHNVLRKRREHGFIVAKARRFPPEPEPLFDPTDVAAELGHAWETWAFGGTTLPTGYPIDMRVFGLRWHPWLWPLNYQNTQFLDFPISEFIIHASSMSSFFSTAGWEKHKNGVQPLTVELTPVRGLYGQVEDKKDDYYVLAFRERLESVHRGISSASRRTPTPIMPSYPALPPLLMEIDIDELMKDPSRMGDRVLRRVKGRVEKRKSNRLMTWFSENGSREMAI